MRDTTSLLHCSILQYSINRPGLNEPNYGRPERFSHIPKASYFLIYKVPTVSYRNDTTAVFDKP